jgi:hypothetical protein
MDMKTLLIVLMMTGSAWGQAATQPAAASNDVAQLRSMILSLQKQVAELRAENATLRRQLGAVGGGKAAELKGGTIAEQISNYVRAGNVDPAIAAKMRRFAPAVGMTEEQLDTLVKVQEKNGAYSLATRKTIEETAAGKAVQYSLARGDEPETATLILERFIVTFGADGKASRIRSLGNDPAYAPGSKIMPKLEQYFRQLGRDPKP